MTTITLDNLNTTNTKTLLQQVVDAANAVYGKNTVLARLCAAQAVLESNLAEKPSLLAVKYNNLFGIKGKGTHGVINLPTKEYKKGKRYSPMQPFAWNATIKDSFIQHKSLIEGLPRYHNLLSAKTVEEAAQEIKQDGYATDPHYTQELIRVYNESLKNLFT